MKAAASDDERLYYLGAALEGMRGTYFRQAMFAEFELRARWNRAENITAPSKPWHHNPVMVKDGKVFILPNDAQHLLVQGVAEGEHVPCM